MWRAALVAGVISLAANLAVWGIASLAGVDIRVPESPGAEDYSALGALPLIFATVLSTVLAAVALRLLERFTSRAVPVFVILGAVLTLLSLGSPLSLTGGAGPKVALSVMHLVTGVVVVGLLALASRGNAGEDGQREQGATAATGA